MKNKVYYVDGGCRNQGAPNRITWEGYGSFCDDEGHVVHFELPQAATNNEAEYMALIELLKTLPVTDDEGPTIYTDSRLLIGQLQGGWKVRAKNLKDLAESAFLRLAAVNAHLVWVPRLEIVRRLGH